MWPQGIEGEEKAHFLSSTIFQQYIIIAPFDRVKKVAEERGCAASEIPLSYIFRHASWDKSKKAVGERVLRRLEIWKKLFLSKRCRLTLKHTIISSLAVYTMPIFLCKGMKQPPRKVK